MLKEGEQLQATLGDQREALALTQAENAELGRVLSEHERSLARTREEARRLAVALAEDGEALSRRSAELRERDEQLHVAKPNLPHVTSCLARLDAIGRAEEPPLALLHTVLLVALPADDRERLGYVKAYLHLRRSDLFDADYYLSRYPDVSHAGLNPLMHYVEHGRREGRQPVGSLELSFLDTSPPSPTESPTLAPPVVPELVPPKPERPPEDVAPEEDDFAAKLRKALAEHVPETAVIAVATGGEEHLLSLPEYRTLHFPRRCDGTYGGDDARGDTSLIANLEATRAAGAEFLLVPATQRSLLERNPRFRRHLLGHYSQVLDSEELGACFALYSPDTSKRWRRQLVGSRGVDRTRGEPRSLDPRLEQRASARGRAAWMQRVHVQRAGTPPPRRKRRRGRGRGRPPKRDLPRRRASLGTGCSRCRTMAHRLVSTLRPPFSSTRLPSRSSSRVMNSSRTRRRASMHSRKPSPPGFAARFSSSTTPPRPTRSRTCSSSRNPIHT